MNAQHSVTQTIRSARFCRLAEAVPLLLAAAEDASDLDEDKWQFALTLGELIFAGVHIADLRWCVAQGYVEHALEVRDGRGRRNFKRVARLRISNRSCFVVTAAGIELANHLLRELTCSKEESVSRHETLHPHWDSDRRELTLDGTLVKQFRRIAQCQEQILAAFEEEGWPVRIDDPLPLIAGKDPEERLHNAVAKLNTRQGKKRVIFSRDGTAQGVKWNV